MPLILVVEIFERLQIFTSDSKTTDFHFKNNVGLTLYFHKGYIITWPLPGKILKTCAKRFSGLRELPDRCLTNQFNLIDGTRKEKNLEPIIS